MIAVQPASAGQRMPVVFIGHGLPENALEENEFTRNWKELARSIPRPKAILSISAYGPRFRRTISMATIIDK